ncbi:MAG: DUF2510 domain-containing protein [Acidimicrobiia bacterium]
MEPTPNPPGWYPDQAVGAPRGQYRYWTGKAWTPHVTQASGTAAKTKTSGARRRWPLITALVLAVLGIALVGGYFVTRTSKSYPKSWDAQVAPIADRVAHLRGLSFDHPVPVRYLTDEQFRKKVAVKDSSLSPAAKRRIQNLAGTLRAFGLLDANTDLVKSFSAAQESGVLAYYDPDNEEIVIRGVGPLDIERKATLAHELTHVLQDQHFDLQSLRSNAARSDTASSGALTALIEGDAERIKAAYLKGLPQADQDAFDAAEAKTGTGIDAEMTAVAEIVKIDMSAPYAFGPEVLRVIASQGGNDAVDKALRRPPPTDAIYLDPAAALKDPKAVTVSKPPLDPGDHQLGNADELGAFDLFTVLASRIDRQAALDAADTWAGDRIVTYRRSGQVCVRATIESATPEGASTLTSALHTWAATMPGSTVSLDAARRRSTLTACDSGASRAPDSQRLEGAMALLGGRNSLLGELLDGGFPVPIGTCVSNGFVKTPLFVSALDRGDVELTAAEKQQAQDSIRVLVGQCRGRSA